ncbi:AMSH-like ubiquitin thioesterase 3 [Turnera subulata]|uniref:AMSH-like ubiquitin thioesterase 3 n=1 Tax=Turnera subulata TaxID=218843 RepID=A0A9Q0GG36_9ROSI|nr:AMSH-like ubiquitin thioesterase 3 [Turnera subulata]
MKIDVDKMTRKIEVDNRMPLRNYYRIADNLLRQANIYREERNVIDLYVILVRYLSLVSETIPRHRDYQALPPKEKANYTKRSFAVLDEVESLKPEFQRRLKELEEASPKELHRETNGIEKTLYGLQNSPKQWPGYATKNLSLSMDVQRPVSVAPQSSWKYGYNNSRVSSPNSLQVDKQLQKLSLGLPLPREETLSRHSILGPNGLRGQWLAPSTQIKIQYPSNMELTSSKTSSLNQEGQYGVVAVKDDDSEGLAATMESVLSLDDGRWLRPAEEACPNLINEAREDPFQFVSIRQPSPPPVLAQVQKAHSPIHPSKVADPRPGLATSSPDGLPSSNSYQHLHVPVNLMEDFLRLAQANTRKNLETCGVLAGSLKNRVFHITTLIIPKQESTSDSCQTQNEEEIFDVQDKLSLFPLGWIHTHPSQTCFMSSVDLHTHYSYQIMLPEAIAIVMAPTDESSPHGIFHLSDPSGVSVIRNCQQRGFHPHEEPEDGSPIYEHCSHVYMNSKLKYDVVDLR